MRLSPKLDVINLDGAEGDVFLEGDVEAAAEDPGEGIVVGLFAEVHAAALIVAGGVDLGEAAIVGAAEHDFDEGNGVNFKWKRATGPAV